jgi:hypothetical protein
MMEGEAMDYFDSADEGYLMPTCLWCGKPAAHGEEIDVIQASSSEVFWAHLNCGKLYSEFCKKQEEDFYTNDVLTFVRGEPSGIKPGTGGEVSAKIAKDLIAKNPSLALPENLQELIAAVEAVEHEERVANRGVITPRPGALALLEEVARERTASRRRSRH